MRWLRFTLAGHLVALAIRIMPAGRLKRTLIDAIADWRDEREAEAWRRSN